MDECFAKVLEMITKLNDSKEMHAKALFFLCLESANLLIGVGNTGTKQVASFVNKMFKMADQYLTLHNEMPNVPAHEKLSRNLINKSFELFKKKKEHAQSEQVKQTTRQSAMLQ